MLQLLSKLTFLPPVSSFAIPGGCLNAPAEVSLWTHFCEVDAPEAARELMRKAREIQTGPLELPDAFAKFEAHMKQPIRIHNIRKRMQQEERKKKEEKKDVEEPGQGERKEAAGEKKEEGKADSQEVLEAKRLRKQEKKEAKKKRREEERASASSTSKPAPATTEEERERSREQVDAFAQDSHVFAEGLDLLLSDLLLLCMFRASEKAVPELRSHLPRTSEWLRQVDAALGNSEQELQFDLANPVGGVVELTVPAVPERSLYKSDPTRQNPNARAFTR